MKLTPHLLRRLRRMMHRRYLSMIPGPPIHTVASAAGRCSSDPKPNKKMRYLCFLVALCIGAFLFCNSCSTTTTRSVDPVTGVVTETSTKSADPAAVAIGGKALDTYATIKASKVREEKSFSGADDPAGEFRSTPNPLDTPEAPRTYWHSSAWGTFGPGGGEVPYRPELHVLLENPADRPWKPNRVETLFTVAWQELTDVFRPAHEREFDTAPAK